MSLSMIIAQKKLSQIKFLTKKNIQIEKKGDITCSPQNRVKSLKDEYCPLKNQSFKN